MQPRNLYRPEGYERSGGHNNLNPDLDILQVTTEGYSVSDMNMYYGGCFLLKYMASRRRYTPVKVVESFENEDRVKMFRYIGSSGTLYSKPCEEFYRFMPESGYYLDPTVNQVFSLSFSNFGYKKGFQRGNVFLRKFQDGRFSVNRNSDEDIMNKLIFVLYPEDKGALCRVIDRVTCSVKDSVMMYPWGCVIGKYDTGTNSLLTPMNALIRRVQELQEDVKCQKI